MFNGTATLTPPAAETYVEKLQRIVADVRLVAMFSDDPQEAIIRILGLTSDLDEPTSPTEPCAYPGDHEHDHEMCRDANEEAADEHVAEARKIGAQFARAQLRKAAGQIRARGACVLDHMDVDDDLRPVVIAFCQSIIAVAYAAENGL